MMIMHYSILISAIVIVIPALLGAFLPRNWRWRAMLFWLVSPAFVYAALIAEEIAARPPQPNDFQNAILGFSLISALFLIPWLILSGVGLAIGLGIGRLLRSGNAEPPRSTAPHLAPSFVLPSQPPALESDGWRSVHVGFSNDGLEIGGQQVWQQPWRPTGEPALMLPHPAHPHQSHRFDIYAIGDGWNPVRFAVGELSNGVWGFYVPAEPPRLHP